jgi:hypothetical protein
MADRSTARIVRLSAECIGNPRVKTRPHEPFPDRADAIEDEVQEARAICWGEAIAALRITLIAKRISGSRDRPSLYRGVIIRLRAWQGQKGAHVERD